MASAEVKLKDGEVRALSTMALHARCVGADKPDPDHGYVGLRVARTLMKRGLCREELSAMGLPVFVLSAEGADALARAGAPDSASTKS